MFWGYHHLRKHPYKTLLVGWWVYPLLYGNNGSLDGTDVVLHSCWWQRSKSDEIYHYLQGFRIHPNGGWEWDFWTINKYENSMIPPIFWWNSRAKKKDDGFELLLFMVEIRLSKWYRKYPCKCCSETNCYRILFINSWLLCHGFSTGTNVKHDSHGSKPWQIMQSNRWGPCDPNLSVLQVNATDLWILDNFCWFPSKTVEHFLAL